MVNKIKELIEARDYKNLKLEIAKLNEVDIAEIIEDLSDEQEQIKIFRLLPKDIAADVFVELPIDLQQDLIMLLSNKEAGLIIDNLEADDAVDLVEEMPANVVTKILANTTAETRKDINYLLKYPVNSAGSIMNNDFLDLKANITIEQAINKVRKEGIDKETIDVCFILDKSRKLLGTIELKDLLFNKSDTIIEDIMDDKVISSYTYEDQEEVASKFTKYNLTVMPVVDSENRLVGVITVDDVVDIINEETTEDIEKMAAISPSDKPYLRTSVLETYKQRILWLLFLMISATFTGKIIENYEAALASYVILTSFIPMIMNTGGNAGGQSSVTVIRGLSLNEIEYKDSLKVLLKEILVSILAGITLAAINFVKMLVIDKVTITIAAVVSLTLVITVIIAKMVGCMLPIAAKRIGFDPAVMASPFITTIVDAISLVAYFTIATIMLGL